MDKIDEFLEEMKIVVNDDSMYPTDMKEAIIGYVERFGMKPQILLDRKKCIDILMKQGMGLEEANEYFEFNTIGSFMGKDRTPCFATLIEK
jgi:hypothetical protein